MQMLLIKAVLGITISSLLLLCSRWTTVSLRPYCFHSVFCTQHFMYTCAQTTLGVCRTGLLSISCTFSDLLLFGICSCWFSYLSTKNIVGALCTCQALCPAYHDEQERNGSYPYRAQVLVGERQTWDEHMTQLHNSYMPWSKQMWREERMTYVNYLKRLV